MEEKQSHSIVIMAVNSYHGSPAYLFPRPFGKISPVKITSNIIIMLF